MRIDNARRTSLVSLGVIALLLFTACASEPEENGTDSGESTGTQEVQVQVASYDLAAGEETRVIAGLITKEQLFVSYGTVEMEFFYGGEDPKGAVEVEAGPTATGEFLAVDEGPGAPPDAPTAGPASEGRGVYAAEVTFDKPGAWVLQIAGRYANGDEFVGNGQFEVTSDNNVAAVGEKAPLGEHLTLSSKDAPPEAVDSRASTLDEVPDPKLHDAEVRDAVSGGQPALVIVSTPVYCVSRFCGPITDMVSDLETEYRDRAEFVHIELWRNYEDQVINKGAAQWVYKGGEITEPWVFLVDADGRVVARWDNVATRGEIEPLLRALPKD